MNETIQLNPRQKAILNILAQNAQLSREEITQQLSITFPASKATLARDLSDLQKSKKILALGKSLPLKGNVRVPTMLIQDFNFADVTTF